jgi:hypothetical protein
VQWNLRGRLSALLFAISVAGIGGFVGGSIMSYGPQYVHVHLTEVFHHSDAEPATVAESVAAQSVEVPAAKVAPVVDEPAEQLAPHGAEARIVMQGKNRSYLVLHSAPEEGWGIGPKRVRGDDFAFTLTQALAPKFATPEIAAWRDTEVTLFSATGYVCSAKVVDLLLLQKSLEGGGDGSSVHREFEKGLFQVAARVEPLRGNCSAAVWARVASLPAPAIGRVGRTKKGLRQKARKEFRKTLDWQALQKRFVKDGGAGKWDSLWDTAPTVQSLRGASEELVMVSAEGGDCGEFEGGLSVFYRVSEDGSLERIASEDLSLGEVVATADIDSDGDLDLIGSRDRSQTLLVRQKQKLVTESSSDALINVCGC